MQYRSVILALILGVLSACSSPAPTTTLPPTPAFATAPSPTPEPQPTAELKPTEAMPEASTVTEISYMLWGSSEEAAILQDVVKDFEKENPTIKVNVEVSDWDSYWDKLKVLHAAGTPPDVFAMDAPLYADWASRGALLNLQPFIDKEPDTLKGVYPIALKNYERPDGYYGLPRDLQTIVLFYNKDMFDKAGVEYPSETWTMEDLRAAAKKLTLDANNDGTIDQWGFYTDLWDMELFWSSVIWSYGGELLSSDYSKTLLAEPKAREAWALIKSMTHEDHSFPTEPSSFTYDEDPFGEGKVAMTTGGHWVVPGYATLDFSWNVAPMPRGPAGRATSVTSGGFVISKQSKSPEAAWKFVKFGVSEAAQKRMSELGFAIPILESVATGPAYVQQKTADIDHRMFVDAIEYAHLKPSFKGYEEWSSVIGDSMTAVWEGENTVDEVLDELVVQADQVLVRNKE